jgi:DnaJ-class molecular chaperone
MTINPYELFGIDPQQTNMKELKRKYYELALLVHPDRNPLQNGEDMDTIYKAYKYCENEITNRNDKETNLESLEKEFEEFCKTQTDSPPSMYNIADDVLEMQKFHETFEQTDGYRASFIGGYQEIMEMSDFNNVRYIEDINFTPDIPLKNDFNSLVVYTEPLDISSANHCYDYTTKEPVKSYSTFMKKTCLSDYKEAHKHQHIDDNIDEKDVQKMYADLVSERELLEKNLKKNKQKPLLSIFTS